VSAFPTPAAGFRHPRSIIDVSLQVEKSYSKKVVGTVHELSMSHY
jgi:hypothetical protein